MTAASVKAHYAAHNRRSVTHSPTEKACQEKIDGNSAEKPARAGPRGPLDRSLGSGSHRGEKKCVYNNPVPA